MGGSDRKSCCKRIKELRKELKLNQTEFAEAIFLKRAIISHYENGVNIPTNSIIAHICNAFNVNKDWLLTGKGEIFIKTAEVTKLEVLAPTKTQEQPAPSTPTETLAAPAASAPTETSIPTENKKTFGRGRFQHARICGKAENVEKLDQSIRSTYMGLTTRLLEESDTEYGKVFAAVQRKYLNQMVVDLEQEQQNLLFYIENAMEQLAAVTQLKESIAEQRKMIGKMSTGNATTDHPFNVPDKLLGLSFEAYQELAGKDPFDIPQVR